MNTTADLLLASTAHWAAAVRAYESECQDPLFNDPWASALAGEIGAEWLKNRAPDSLTPMIVRTRFFDDFMMSVTRPEGLRQVVLMAAGLDTRAYRLDWPDHTRLFELDQPTVLAHKERILQASGVQPACARQKIEQDLTARWVDSLTTAGFDGARPCAWLLEGFLFYLPIASIVHILDDITKLASPGSWIGFDIINSAVLTSPWTRNWVAMQTESGAPWIGALDDPHAFLSERGWQASLTQPGEPDANYGRWSLPVLPVLKLDLPHLWFVTARKTG